MGLMELRKAIASKEGTTRSAYCYKCDKQTNQECFDISFKRSYVSLAWACDECNELIEGEASYDITSNDLAVLVIPQARAKAGDTRIDRCLLCKEPTIQTCVDIFPDREPNKHLAWECNACREIIDIESDL
jgi:hypothetical protein